MPLRGLFVTGTDTGVGKTWVTAGIVKCLRARGMSVGAYKPVASGSVPGPHGPEWEDVERLAEAVDRAFPSEMVCPQRFQAPLAPPAAAEREGKVVDAARLQSGAAWWSGRVEALIVEGVGGLLAPLAIGVNVADLAVELGFPLLVVARRSLGTLNHTLLTLEGARSRGLQVAGIVLNQATPPDPDDLAWATNRSQLAAWTEIPILAELDHSPGSDLLRCEAFFTIQWEQLLAEGKLR
ncbi:MAG: dethiobiotin synthase [Planctomycetales bacterium]